jgi:pyruvate dehydrogenase E2 component (dihydrolipoamide acetyltransferase)
LTEVNEEKRMASEIKLPELGENLEGGEVLEIKVAPGETVSEGQTLLELEAEKSTVEVPSPLGGRLMKVLVKKGDNIRVGQAICLIEAGAPMPNGESPDVETAPGSAPSHSMPSHEPTAAPVARVEQMPPADGFSAGVAPAQAPPADKPRSRLVPAGPATRRLARELGIDLGLIQGSAHGGRVTQEDVKAYVRQMAASPPPVLRGPASPIGQQPPLPDFERWGQIERQPMDVVRRKTAEQMSLAWSQVPHVTQHDEADITDLDSFRRQQESSGPRLTVTAFALKAAASALKQFPRFNASLDSNAGLLIFKKYYHIGVAVDTERGLLVPVLRDVDKKSVRELAQELAATAEKARQRKVTLEDLRGGTFTITNLGGIGGTAFTPIVNYPEVAILGMSRSRLQPVIRGGQVVPRLILPLSVSYDHRVIDGADAARFTRRITEMLENPLQMLL